jgi:hypothetical protein
MAGTKYAKKVSTSQRALRKSWEAGGHPLVAFVHGRQRTSSSHRIFQPGRTFPQVSSEFILGSKSIIAPVTKRNALRNIKNRPTRKGESPLLKNE